ncbi:MULTISPECIES: hypothetical protein [Burkholderia]|uniref:hypothetical protein n=1 Tax=Burkholderia TaxID=32008 RepID=UPI00117C096E|nr:MULTISPECIES: hypothetical protein [Burkholderia]
MFPSPSLLAAATSNARCSGVRRRREFSSRTFPATKEIYIDNAAAREGRPTNTGCAFAKAATPDHIVAAIASRFAYGHNRSAVAGRISDNGSFTFSPRQLHSAVSATAFDALTIVVHLDSDTALATAERSLVRVLRSHNSESETEASVSIRISKLEAARRQLRTAIRMLFDEADPVAIHTLVGAASVLAADLAKHHHPDQHLEKLAQKANNLTSQQYFEVARETQNFLKHADQDIDEVHEFDPIDTDALAVGAIRNLANFGILSLEESALELWYIACNDPEGKGYAGEWFAEAAHFFGDLRNSDRPARLAKGREVLNALRRVRESEFALGDGGRNGMLRGTSR